MPQEPLVRRTATTLSDGRELIYYDDSEPYLSGGATRRLDDPRPLPDRFVSPIGAPAAVSRHRSMSDAASAMRPATWDLSIEETSR